MDAFGAAAIFLYSVVLVGTGAHAARSIARWRRLRDVHVVVATHRHAGEACMVCASRAVRMIAPYVMRCDACGFLGGASVPPLRAVLARAIDPTACPGRPNPFGRAARSGTGTGTGTPRRESRPGARSRAA